MPLVTTSPYKDLCEGQGFTEDFETGDFSKWDYVSSTGTPSLVASPAFGSFSMRIANGINDNTGTPWQINTSGAQKDIDLGECMDECTFKFRFDSGAALDDPFSLNVRDGASLLTSGQIFHFNPRRAAPSDPARRFQFNDTLYQTLTAANWYKLRVYNINWSANTLDFELFDINGSPETFVTGDTGLTIVGTGANYITIINQPGDANVSNIDDIVIS